MIEVLLLALIPAASWATWILAKSTTRRGERKRNRNFSSRYFQGLNYLLDEQPDKAIAVFIEMAEVTADTVETHLALGSLFRRRGEVERAIRVHQNIISKPGLAESQKTRALLELGEDYMRAGLFDRAENLFKELTQRDSHVPSALRHLLDIYQQEKDWEKALEQAKKLEAVTDEKMGLMMAHFCCELAETDLSDNKPARINTPTATDRAITAKPQFGISMKMPLSRKYSAWQIQRNQNHRPEYIRPSNSLAAPDKAEGSIGPRYMSKSVLLSSRRNSSCASNTDSPVFGKTLNLTPGFSMTVQNRLRKPSQPLLLRVESSDSSSPMVSTSSSSKTR